MEKVLNFMRSQTYANFWKFMLTGSLVSGVLTAISFAFGYFRNSNVSNIPMSILIPFSFGAFYGVIAAGFGYWIVYFLSQWKINFKVLSIGVGFLLACAVLSTFMGTVSTVNLSSWAWILIFPGIPFFGSIYFFWKFSEKWIKPVLKS